MHLFTYSYSSAPLASKSLRTRKGSSLHAAMARPTPVIPSSPRHRGHLPRPLSMLCTSCSGRRSGAGPLARPSAIGQPLSLFLFAMQDCSSYLEVHVSCTVLSCGHGLLDISEILPHFLVLHALQQIYFHGQSYK